MKISENLPQLVTEKPEEERPPALPPGHFLPEGSLPHAFNVVSNRVSLTLQAMYSEQFGLSVAGWRILAILGTHSPLSAKTLAELTAMDQVSVSRAVEQLTSKKLVSRRVDTEDRRRVALRLTRRGEDVYNQVLPVLYASERALTSVLNDEDVIALRRIMKILVEHSGKVFADDYDWKALLDTFGYGAEARPSTSGTPSDRQSDTSSGS
jgi:DNA-binding MarR family transcriptional regulator